MRDVLDSSGAVVPTESVGISCRTTALNSVPEYRSISQGATELSKFLGFLPCDLFFVHIGAVAQFGRAIRSQRIGRRFDPAQLHDTMRKDAGSFGLSLGS